MIVVGALVEEYFLIKVDTEDRAYVSCSCPSLYAPPLGILFSQS